MSSSEESDSSVELEPRTREVIATDPDKSKSFVAEGAQCRMSLAWYKEKVFESYSLLINDLMPNYWGGGTCPLCAPMVPRPMCR